MGERGSGGAGERESGGAGEWESGRVGERRVGERIVPRDCWMKKLLGETRRKRAAVLEFGHFDERGAGCLSSLTRRATSPGVYAVTRLKATRPFQRPSRANGFSRSDLGQSLAG